MNYQISAVRRTPAENKVEFEIISDGDLTYTAVFDGTDNTLKVSVSMFRQANPYRRIVASRFKKVRADIAERILRWLEAQGINLSDEAREAGGYTDPCQEICYRLGGSPLEGILPEGTKTFPVKRPVAPPRVAPPRVAPPRVAAPVAPLPAPVAEVAPAAHVAPVIPVTEEAPVEQLLQQPVFATPPAPAPVPVPEPAPVSEPTPVIPPPPTGAFDEDGFEVDPDFRSGIRPQVDESGGTDEEGVEPEIDDDREVAPCRV